MLVYLQCRLSLVYAGAKFTDVRVDAGEYPSATYKKVEYEFQHDSNACQTNNNPPPPSFDCITNQAWFDRKKDLMASVPFPNLPYLLEDATGNKPVAMVQTRAILRHIGRKYDLIGHDIDTFDVLLDECSDFDDVLTGLSYSNFDSAKSVFEEELRPKLEQFTAHLERAGPFLNGKDPCVADFKFFDTLSKLKVAEQEAGTHIVASSPAIMEYVSRVENLPAIAAYLASSAFLDRPL